MAKAIQCDRCKKFSALVNDNRDLPVIASDQPQWTRLNPTQVMCDACSLDLVDFMANVVSVDPGNGTIKQDQLNRQIAAKQSS